MDLYLQSAISLAAQTKLPILIWGGPGTGKTSFVKQLASALDLHIETIIASIREPSDFAGLPVLESDGVSFCPPSWAKRLISIEDGVLFIDEISTTPPAVQAALLRVIHEGVVGDVVLPPNIIKIAAANPPEQAAGGWTLSPPLANRFVHFDWGIDHEVWADGAINGWKVDYGIKILPDDWQEYIPKAMSLISSYIRTRPTHLYGFPQNDSEAGKAWASPRTWEMAGILMAAADAVNAPEDVRIPMFAGVIGYSEAYEFTTWLKDLDLPDPEKLLENPDKFKVPERSDQIYAVLTSVVSATIHNLTEQRWKACWKILAIIATDKAPDIAAFAAKQLVRNSKKDMPIPKKEVAVFLPIMSEVNAI